MPAPVVQATTPADGATGVRGLVRPRFEWVSGGGGDPVRLASLTLRIVRPNGVTTNLTSASTTSAITSGYAIEYEPGLPLQPGDEFTVESDADSVATAGSPVTETATFTMKGRGAVPYALTEGRVRFPVPTVARVLGNAARSRPISALVEGLAAARGLATLRAALIEGNSRKAPGMLDARVGLVEGRIGVFRSQAALMVGLLAGLPGSEQVVAGVHVEGQGAHVGDLTVGMEVTGQDVTAGRVDIGLSVEFPVSQAAVMVGLAAGTPGAQQVVAGAAVEGAATEGMIEYDSPSQAWVDAGDA